NVYGWLDYQSKLSAQRLSQRFIVLYNASGKNLAAAVFDRKACSLPFVVDHKLYWIPCDSLEEGDYLAAVLNAPAANEAIKPFQSLGLMGERDIHKKILDLPIPEYDARKPLHITLATLGSKARKQMSRLVEEEKQASLGRQRQAVRGELNDLL